MIRELAKLTLTSAGAISVGWILGAETGAVLALLVVSLLAIFWRWP